jgi:hypothetical protein
MKYLIINNVSFVRYLPTVILYSLAIFDLHLTLNDIRYFIFLLISFNNNTNVLYFLTH